MIIFLMITLRTTKVLIVILRITLRITKAPSGPSDYGPSDSGPSSSSDGGLLSKIWANFVLSFSSFFETLVEIAPNADILIECVKL